VPNIHTFLSKSNLEGVFMYKKEMTRDIQQSALWEEAMLLRVHRYKWGYCSSLILQPPTGC